MNDENDYVIEQYVLKIQKFWRSYIDKQVFKYYCKLINFKNRGDPCAMLRCINPKEIELFDAAFGSRIKFRLGGEKFPPNIYYKIFTHRPIQDLCANSPKNYSRIRRKDARVIHNRYSDGDSNSLSTADWYKRIENNGWRPISERIVTKIFYSDPITCESAAKPVPFEHDRNRKLENKRNQRKKIKLKWLRKMYNMNLLSVDSPDNLDNLELTETKELVRRATESMIETCDKRGDEFVEDWAVDELLGWTSGLRYDDYLDDWNALATSLVSDWRIDLGQNKGNK